LAPPLQITLDLDATDDPLHGHQEDRFFHGYYDNYCYLPLYVFCGRHLLAAKLRPANIDASAGSVEEMARIVARIRQRWPKVRILLRADSYTPCGLLGGGMPMPGWNILHLYREEAERLRALRDAPPAVGMPRCKHDVILAGCRECSGIGRPGFRRYLQ
jgi:hypothetical protein